MFEKSEIPVTKPSENKQVESFQRKEKVLKLEEMRKNVETLADGLGKGIDEGIKETVAVFNVLDIPTSQSCEGHPDRESGGPYPWVRVAAEEEPVERFVGEAEAFENMALQHGVLLETLKRGEPEDLYWEVQKQISVNEETPAFQEWIKKNIELQEKVQALLYTFYQGRTVSDDMKLIVDKGVGGVFHVRSDEPAELAIILGEITPEEFSSVVGKLGARQEEMRTFTDFLRDKIYLKL